jgi:hypothetical protein
VLADEPALAAADGGDVEEHAEVTPEPEAADVRCAVAVDHHQVRHR